jgi:hypothetical protein
MEKRWKLNDWEMVAIFTVYVVFPFFTPLP